MMTEKTTPNQAQRIAELIFSGRKDEAKQMLAEIGVDADAFIARHTDRSWARGLTL
jgi:hypothetical protein